MDNNPLKQYFRRPVLYLKLPSNGVGYAEGALDLGATGELAIYPMTAVDEMTSRTPDALFNGTAVIDIIKSCVPGIKNPWEILSVDLDPILIAIKAAGNNGEMDIESNCPSCAEDNKYGINLSLLLTNLKPADYDKTFNIKDLKIKFKPLTYKQYNETNLKQFELQRGVRDVENIQDENLKSQQTSKIMKLINMLTLEILVDTIDYIETPNAKVTEREFIVDYFNNCDRQTFNAIREYSIKLREESKIKPLDLKCTHCQHDYKQELTLNISDFFE